MKKEILQTQNEPRMALFLPSLHTNTPLSAQRPIATHFIPHKLHEQWHYALFEGCLVAYTISGI
jgi:hypothetical protein